MSEDRPDLSVIAPLYNEQESVGPLYEAILTAMGEYHGTFEIIFVDDGSRDETYASALRLAKQDPRLKLLKFRRNFGQTPAMVAGIDHAEGRVLVTMDGDLQNDPRDIIHLVSEIESGADIAVGWRFKRQDKLITRKIPSHIANWLIGKVTGVPIKDNGCSLKAYRSEVIKRVPLYSEMHRFIPAMSSITGARVSEIKVRHHARKFGQSKYGLSRIYKVLLDLLVIKTITTFAARPLHWYALMASPFAAIALLLLGVAAWQTLYAPDLSLVILSGLAVLTGATASFLLVCGILCELVYRMGDARTIDFSRLTATQTT